MADVVLGTFTMGPLLRKHFDAWCAGGDPEAERFVNSLTEAEKNQLGLEMMYFANDGASQEAAAEFRSNVESTQGRLGFAIN